MAAVSITAANLSRDVQPSEPTPPAGSNWPFSRPCRRHLRSVASEIPSSRDNCRRGRLFGGSMRSSTAPLRSGEHATSLSYPTQGIALKWGTPCGIIDHCTIGRVRIGELSAKWGTPCGIIDHCTVIPEELSTGFDRWGTPCGIIDHCTAISHLSQEVSIPWGTPCGIIDHCTVTHPGEYADLLWWGTPCGIIDHCTCVLRLGRSIPSRWGTPCGIIDHCTRGGWPLCRLIQEVGNALRHHRSLHCR